MNGVLKLQIRYTKHKTNFTLSVFYFIFVIFEKMLYALQKLEGSWIEVSAGHFHGCGIQSDGKAYCWGNNRNGRMGTGKVSEPGEYELNPQAVKSDDREWVSISAKGSHTCGLKEDNTAWCWGGNEVGLAFNEA